MFVLTCLLNCVLDFIAEKNAILPNTKFSAREITLQYS